ncbi:response regulator [bacterium]|nr:MAG: response regulator [bacterium]
MNTVIVVDDNPDITDIVKMILEVKGHHVICVRSGPELFSQLAEQKPDLIFLDIMMPGMDGFEVLKRLRDTPNTSSIPVILLTAKGQYEDVLRGYKEGADYYIPKPFISTQLLTAINLVLGKSQT